MNPAHDAIETLDMAKKLVKAHQQLAAHKYTVHYPEHGPRSDDPHYIDFEHYKKTHPNPRCLFQDYADGGQCVLDKPMELHHAHIEFALTNGVDFATLEKYYPGISDPNQVGAWVESDQNFVFYCQFHHRGHGGAHVAAAADFESQKWVKGFIS